MFAFLRPALAAFVVVAVAALSFPALARQQAALPRPHNVIIFVADGLRSASVTPQSAPEMARIRAGGVDFANSHSLFPTVTTANASAIATGHGLGDTGDFGNKLWVGFTPVNPRTGLLAGLEDDETLGLMNARFGGDYLGEDSLLQAARRAGFVTAAIGKQGPAAIQDVTARDGRATIIIDDRTGNSRGVPLDPAVEAAIRRAGMAPLAPGRGLNEDPGDFRRPGVVHANVEQQDWFTRVAVEVVLPRFKASGKPFAMVFWSRDPDGSQHDQGDSLNTLSPGINGPTGQAGIRNADSDLARLRAALKRLGLDRTTDIVVTADHGFSTISRQSQTSGAARGAYPDVVPGFLPPGFLPIDLSRALALPLWSPTGKPLDPAHGQHGSEGDALIGNDPTHPDLALGSAGGAELIWLPGPARGLLARKIVDALFAQDYTAAVFAADDLGPIAGTLPLSAVGLVGSARTPRPDLVVSLKSFSTGCANAELCAVQISETNLQQGQGQHGALSRANTHNFMAAIGPDFRRRFRDPAPVSNADLTPTLARILNLSLHAHGRLQGRVISEALAAGGKPPRSTSQVIRSTPSGNGLVTELKVQEVGRERYLDWAGIAGRVVKGPGG